MLWPVDNFVKSQDLLAIEKETLSYLIHDAIKVQALPIVVNIPLHGVLRVWKP